MHTLAIPLTPKIITRATSEAMMMPLMCDGTPHVSLTRSAIELDCTILPMPRAATAVKMQKSIANHFMFNPRSSAYIGPPDISPLAFVTRYLIASNPSEYLVAMPSTPVSQHQNTAPGPPRDIAVATPMILPVPIVAANAVARAANWLTSPFDFLSL